MAGLVSFEINPGSIIGALGSLIDELFTSDEERMAAKHKLVEMEQQGRLAQIEVNKIEAASSSIFVAGWRPFIGWVCGCGVGWAFLGAPIAEWAVAIWSPGTTMPMLHTDGLLELVLALLGLGALRTFEKVKGAA
jgi:holin (3TMs family)